jgi:hypothetical protein
MKVINIFGTNFVFEKFSKLYSIPYDGYVYEIPDECIKDDLNGILRVIVPPKPKVVNNIQEIKIEELKNDKPLKGKKIKSELRKKLRKTRNTGKNKKVGE